MPFTPRTRCSFTLPSARALALALSAISVPLTPLMAAPLNHYDIQGGSLADVLSRYARASGVAISFETRQLANQTSSGLRGEYGVDEGFAALLRGHGLQAVSSNDGYVLIAAPQNQGAVELGATRVNANLAGASSEDTQAYTIGSTTTATKLPLSLRETPQSVSVITRQQMDDQGMKNLDDVMQMATGITVVKNGGERSLYMARGQLVDTLQIDGIPTNISNAYSMDAISKPTTDLYDRIEIVRGATGLLDGAGNPSASINLVRKRPTAAPQAIIETSVGSWDNDKVMIDLSSPLNDQGTIRGRTVVTYNNANSYMDTTKKENQVFYTLLEADLSKDTLATLGLSYQKERNSGYDWSGLPTMVDGKFYPLSRSTSLTGKWNHLDKRNTTVFGDIQHYFDNDWKLVVAANQTWAKSDFLGNYTQRVGGTENRFTLNPRHFRYDDTQTSVDTYLSGPFNWMGKQHDLVVGTNVRVDDFDYHGGRDASYKYEFDITDLGSFNPPAPTGLNVNQWKYNITQKQAGLYAASRFSLSDTTKLIVGSRVSWFKNESLVNVTRPIHNDYSKDGQFTPYAGLVQELNEHFTAYTSYTEIFKPQSNLGVNGSPLKPMTGSNYELGLKGEFLDKRLNSSIALFQTDQIGRAEAYSADTAQSLCPDLPNGCYKASEKVRNRGIDLELNGALTPDWNLSTGYTYTQSKYAAGSQKGEDSAASAPRHLFKVATDYRLPGVLNKTRVGGTFYVQSKITHTEVNADYKIEQQGYALTSLHASYDISKNLEVQYNLDNVFDKKYIQTTGNDNYWNFYGAPRNFNLALKATF